ncbi:hypothetical protein [Legionella gresilensis]|uniref:hypothetical protein n=1 Tax=Legionella gresilensis TaxID=91823 RepID=UPI001040FF6A|nr:hypothetical protein [Legionella gresilensis]
MKKEQTNFTFPSWKIGSVRTDQNGADPSYDDFKFLQSAVLGWQQSRKNNYPFAWISNKENKHYVTLSDAIKDLPLNINSLQIRIEVPVDVKDLVKAFAELQPGIDTLDFNLSHLGLNMSTEDLEQVFSAIPKHIKTLNLANNALDAKTGEELAQIIQALPSHINSLNLGSNNLGDKTVEELLQIIKALPSHITSFNLGYNGLGKKLGKELVQIVKALPNSIKSFNLGYSESNLNDSNNSELDRYNSEYELNKYLLQKTMVNKFIQVLGALPNNIVKFDIGGEEYSKLKAVEIEKILESLPNHVRYLEDGIINIIFKKGKELEDIVRAIPKQLTSLNLSNQLIARSNEEIQDMRRPPIEELVQMIKAIPKNIVKLDLSGNELNELSSEELAQLVKALPDHIGSLNLARNNFYKVAAAELAHIFSSISKRVTSLNLSSNGLGVPVVKDLPLILSAIPPGVTHLNLSNNELDQICNHLDQAFRALPKHVSSLNLVGNHLDSFSIKVLEKIANSLPYIKTIKLNYEEIQKMSFEQRKALKSVFNNVEKVIWSDADGHTLQFNTSHTKLVAQRCAQELCSKLNSSPINGGLFYKSNSNEVVDKGLEGKEELQEKAVNGFN